MNPTYNTAPTPLKITFRISVLFVTLLGMFNSHQLSAQTLKMRFAFGDTGTTTTDAISGVVLNLATNGVATDLHGAAGSGPAGQGKCLNLSGGAYNTSIAPVASTTGNTTISFGTVSNFTVTLWIKPRGSDSPLTAGSYFSRFFILGANGDTDDNQANSIGFQNGSTAPASVNHLINTTGNTALYVTNPPTLMGTTAWTFLAMTFDGTNASIYAGSESNAASFQQQSSLSSGQTVNLGSSFSLFIGNRSAATRVLQGYMADVRFYTGAASSNYLENVRESAVPPSAPTGLSAVGYGSEASLSWNTVTNATGYIIKRSGSSGTETNYAIAATNSYVDTAVTVGNTYYYTVAATNSGGAISTNASEVFVTVTTTPFPLAWATSGSGTWDTSSSNWKNSGGALTTYSDGSSVTFGDSYISANTVVTLSSTVSPAGITANNSLYNYTISGSGTIAGATALTKSGSGILTLSNPNTYSGGTTNNAGILEADNNTAMGTGLLTLNGGILSNSVSSTLTNSISLSAAGTVGVLSGSTLTLGGVISGGNSLSMAGPGTLTLTNANTYIGNTTVGGGKLRLVAPGSVYSAAYNATSVITISNGAALEFDNWGYGSTLSFGQLDFGSSRIVVNGGTLRNVASGASYQARGCNIGTVGGTLDSSVSGQLWTISANSSYPSMTISGLMTLAGAGNGDIDKNITGAGGLNMNGSGTWTLTGTNTFSGPITVSAGTLTIGGAGQLGSGSFSALITNNSLFKMNSFSSQTLAGAITGSGILAQSGSGTLILNGANTYSGGTTNSAGILEADYNTALGTGLLTMSGGILSNSVSSALTNGISLTAAGTVGVANGNMLTLGGVIANTGALTMTGPGTLTLTNQNTFTGNTTVGGGKLRLVAPGSLYSAAYTATPVVSITNGAVLEFDSWFYGAAYSFGQLDFGSSRIFLNGGTLRSIAANGTGAGRSLSIGTAGGTLDSSVSGKTWTIFTDPNAVSLPVGGLMTLTGVGNGEIDKSIVGTGGLAMSGSGTWSLTGTNTYAGTNYISGGTLLVNGDSSAVTNLWMVANGTTLGGSGIIGGNVSFSSGALATNSVGSPLAIHGTLTLNNNTINVATTSALTRGNYLLLTNAASSISGSFGSLNVSGAGLAANTTSNLVQSANAIYLAVNSTPTVTVNVGSYTYNGTGNGPNTVTISLTPDNGAVTWSYVGTGGTTYGPSGNAPTNAGSYTATATVAADSANNLNAASSSAASFTISTKAASVTADAKTKTYGAVNPTLTASVTGTVNGDTLSYTLATDATQYSAVGVSNIVVTLGSNPNYNISATNSTLTINQASTFVGASSTKNPSGYKDAISFTATLPADATGSVVFFSTNGAFSTNTVSGASTTSLSVTNLPRGTNLISIAYLGDSNYLGSTNTLSQIVTNHPPVTDVMTVTRTAGLALIIKLSDIATNWSDADGDPAELTGVTMQSTNGVNLFALNWSTNLDGSIVTTNGYAYIGYTNSPNVADQISYGISDGQGGTNLGYINIVIQGSVTGTNSITSHDFSSPYSNTVTAYGIPYFYYTLERSTNLTSPVWVDVSTNQAAANGVINAADTFWDLGGFKPSPSAFYQLKWQP
jgi:autotransporter-associated beta strand protein